MGDVLNWRGGPDFHPSSFIKEEMAARNWTIDRMATAMAAVSAGDPRKCALELEMYFAVGPTDDRLRLGETGRKISRAFGLSDSFFDNLERSWLEARAIAGDTP